MKHIIRPLTPLFLTLLFMMVGNGFYMTFASLRVSLEGSSNIMIGFINSAYYFGMMLGSVYIEKLIERIGHIRAFSLYAALNIIAVLLQLHLLDPLWWMFFRFLIGMCCASYFIVIESWLLLGSTALTRGKVLSLYMVVLYAGQGSGQFILNFVSLQSTAPFLIAALIASFAILPITLIKGSGPVHVETVPVKLFYLLKKAPVGVLGCFIAGLVLSSFYGLGPIFAKEIGFSKAEISQLMASTIIGGLILQWPIGHLSDIFDRPKVLVGICLALAATCFSLFLLQEGGFLPILLLCILFGGLSFTLYPLAISYTCDHFSPYLIVKITCSLLVVYGIGCIFGPVIAALVMKATTPSGLFLYNTFFALVLGLISFYPVFRGTTVSADQQGDYMPLPRTTSLVNYLYPRGKGVELEMDDDEDDGE